MINVTNFNFYKKVKLKLLSPLILKIWASKKNKIEKKLPSYIFGPINSYNPISLSTRLVFPVSSRTFLKM